ncbi:PREDICTED: uncharacterized protein LOC103319891 [Prunus mume]|uniref:Uncharacterized protein LOC103319891 n=1 Tax=Prunus mume TaxID=102107 RepID=A0ABM0N570_PRUMU|nr:PREDICTED: uncharacterized protein LOC103319891 [Prunus mume]
MKRTKVVTVVHKSAATGMWTNIGILGVRIFNSQEPPKASTKSRSSRISRNGIDCMHWEWKNCPTAWQGDYGNRKGQKTGVLVPEQKLAAVIRMLAYGASADQVDEVVRMGKSTTLEALNCPTALQGDYGNRKCQKSIILEAVAGFDTWVWHAFFGVAGAQNDLNVLGQSPVFNDILRGQGPNITYQINNTVYQTGKDVERCFDILQARWLIVRGAARMFDEEIIRNIMMTCIILHNMIVEDEYDYDAGEVYERDPMNTALTRIYERPMGLSGEPFEPEPLVRDDRFMTRMIDRYTEMQSSYIHERRKLDLMEHLWAVSGNEDE